MAAGLKAIGVLRELDASFESEAISNHIGHHDAVCAPVLANQGGNGTYLRNLEDGSAYLKPAGSGPSPFLWRLLLAASGIIQMQLLIKRLLHVVQEPYA